MKDPQLKIRWSDFIVTSIWLAVNAASAGVTWRMYGAYAALGWLSATIGVIAICGADIIIRKLDKGFDELKKIADGLIRENDELKKELGKRVAAE